MHTHELLLRNRTHARARAAPLAAVKDSAEKDAFFKRLPANVPAIPQPVAVRKLLPLLSRALEFGGAPASAVSSLLLIGR